MAFNKAKALQEAHKYVTQGKNALAIRQYLSILENDPSDLILLNTIGDLYVREKNLPQGLKHFYKLADAYIEEGFVFKAIAIYKKIAKIDRNTAEPSMQLAELYLNQGLVREAREQFTKAFEFYQRTNQPPKALEVLRRLTRLDPENPRRHLQLAQHVESSGDAQGAAEAYLEAATVAQRCGDATTAESAMLKAAELDPNSPGLELFRAREAFDRQQPDQVEKILLSAPSLQDHPRAQRLLLETYLATHNLEAAGSQLLRVFRANPSDFSLVAEYATQCLARQDYDRAFEAVSAVVRNLTEHKKAAQLLEVLRKIQEAAPRRIDNLELMYEICEESAEELAVPEILEALGRAYEQAGEIAKAEQAYARLVLRRPLNPSYQDLLKQVLNRHGKEYKASDLPALASGKAPAESPSGPSTSPEAESRLPASAAAGSACGLGEIESIRSPSADAEALPQADELPQRACEIPPFNSQESRDEIEFYLSHGLQEEAKKEVRTLETRYPAEPGVAVLRRLLETSQQKGEQPEAPEEESQPILEASFPVRPRDTVIDLASELAASLGDRQESESHPLSAGPAADCNPAPENADEVSTELSTLLDELEQGESADEAHDDPQTHYNFGVAFLEMGLHEEAIGEFQKVVKGARLDGLPPNYLQACTLLAACFAEKGMPAVAAQWYSRALEIPGLEDDAVLALRYDLGAALEQAGDRRGALERFTEVYSQNIDYRDVAEKIRILRGKAS